MHLQQVQLDQLLVFSFLFFSMALRLNRSSRARNHSSVTYLSLPLTLSHWFSLTLSSCSHLLRASHLFNETCSLTQDSLFSHQVVRTICNQFTFLFLSCLTRVSDVIISYSSFLFFFSPLCWIARVRKTGKIETTHCIRLNFQRSINWARTYAFTFGCNVSTWNNATLTHTHSLQEKVTVKAGDFFLPSQQVTWMSSLNLHLQSLILLFFSLALFFLFLFFLSFALVCCTRYHLSYRERFILSPLSLTLLLLLPVFSIINVRRESNINHWLPLQQFNCFLFNYFTCTQLV